MGRLQAWLGISAFEELAAHACLESLMLLKDYALQVRSWHGNRSAASETLFAVYFKKEIWSNFKFSIPLIETVTKTHWWC